MSKDINDHVKAGGKFTGRGEPPKPPETRKVPLEKLRLEERCQCRATRDADTVAEYAEAYRSGAELPPIDAFEVDGELVVVDGFHRFAAALQAKRSFLMTRVVGRGTLDDAALRALAANRTHGLRRSNADKRRAVTLALEHPGLRDKSDRQVAELVGVGHPLVAEVRRHVEESSTRARNAAELHDRDPPSAPPKRQDSAGRWQPATKPAPTAPARANGNGRAQSAVTSPPRPPPSGPPAGPKGMPSSEPWERAAAIVREARLKLGELLRDNRELPQSFNGLVDNLHAVEAGFRQATPVSCPSCDGAGCFLCRDRGWVLRGAAESQKKVAEARR